MNKSAVIVCMGLGLAACQPALRPDTGYPAGWPALTALAPGFAELAGTYANGGTATTATGGTVPISLSSLLEGCKARAASGAAAGGRQAGDSGILRAPRAPGSPP